MIDGHLTIRSAWRATITGVLSCALVCAPSTALLASDTPAGSGTTSAASTVDHDTVLPILLLRCAVCHGLRRQEADLDVRTRAALLRGGKSGPAIVPGRAEDSLLIKRLRAQEMPPRKRLKPVSVKPALPREIETLARWIDAGAPAAARTPDVATSEPDPLVAAADRLFWSFRTPCAPELPPWPPAARPANPLDAFVLRKLTDQQGTFSPAASRQALIRRACYDLTGLPP